MHGYNRKMSPPNKVRALTLLTLAAIALATFAHATDPDEGALDPASTEALSKTQNLMTNPDLRNAAISKSPDAQLVDTQVQALGGNAANAESIYGLSSAVFEDIVKKTQGDPVKLQELLKQAKDNPKAFADQLSEKNKAALQDIAGKISDSPTTARNPAAGSSGN